MNTADEEKPIENLNENNEDDSVEELPDAAIPEEVKPFLKGMPDAQRKAVKAIVVAMSVKKSFRGPLPPTRYVERI